MARRVRFPHRNGGALGYSRLVASERPVPHSEPGGEPGPAATFARLPESKPDPRPDSRPDSRPESRPDSRPTPNFEHGTPTAGARLLAALEASVRYLAAELGPEKQVRVNAISAGPIRTLASSAIGGILDMIHNVEAKAPLQRTVTQQEVGNTAAFLASPLSSGITGQVIYVDAGYCITGM